MHRKLLLVLVPTICILLASTTLYLGRDRFTRLPFAFQNKATSLATISTRYSDQSGTLQTQTAFPNLSTAPSTSSSVFAATTASVKQSDGTLTKSPPASLTQSTTPYVHDTAILNGTILAADAISPYITAILDPAATKPSRLECPALNTTRYEALRQEQPNLDDSPHIEFFFALDLRNCLHILSRLLGSIVETAQFLEPRRCALSIVEGNSPDGTSDVLVALRPYLDRLGLSYYYTCSDVNPAKGNRIRKLAELRNLALQPMFDNADRVSKNTTVLFVNDVAACPEDLLELALQRRTLGADMTCAMDWTYAGPDPTFYDVWVARTIEGDSFFEIPSDGNWNSAWNLFWNAPETSACYFDNLPFQVFSCWNGAAAISAAPFLEGLRFRDARSGKGGECIQGEPQILCKEMWFRGYRKIAVVPTVNFEYSDEKGRAIKQLKGYTSDWTRDKVAGEESIDWIPEPPESVKCMPTWSNQFWRPWNETLHA